MSPDAAKILDWIRNSRQIWHGCRPLERFSDDDAGSLFTDIKDIRQRRKAVRVACGELVDHGLLFRSPHPRGRGDWIRSYWVNVQVHRG